MSALLPLYGFLEGDTVGLLILASADESLASLAEKLVHAAELRVARKTNPRVVFRGQILDPKLTIEHAGLGAMDRFDVIEGREG